MRKILISLFVIILILAGLAVAAYYGKLPLNSAAESQISKLLQSLGLKVNSFKVVAFNNSRAELQNINLGEDRFLEVGEIKSEYEFKKLLNKQVKTVSINDVKINIYEKDGKLVVGGLEPLMQSQTGTGSSGSLYKSEFLKQYLSDKVDITALQIAALIGSIDFSGTVDSVSLSSDMKLAASGKAAKLVMLPYDVTIGGFNVDAALNEGKWQGKANLDNVIIAGLPTDMPALKIASDFIVSEKDYSANILVNDSKKTTSASFKLDNKNLRINYAKIPWGGGIISANNASLPLQGKQPVKFTIKVDKVELSSIFGHLSEGKITGEGKLSGEFPVIYYPNGHIAIDNGVAAAIENGVINVSASLLAGDNEQLQMARELLQNFHYTKLKMSVSSKLVDGKDKTALKLELSGNNPEALGGKQVNFNINISGDVLPLLQQSILPVNDVKQLMQMKDTK